MNLRTPLRTGLAIYCAAFLCAGTSEYEMKAAYLYNFVKFVEWPKVEVSENLAICIYGKDPFGGFLDEAVHGKLAHGLPIVVRRLRAEGDSVTGCHVLFISGNSVGRIEQALGRVQGRSVLTVGESDGFARDGGMIGLIVDHGRVRFDINLTALAGSHLQASSRLIEIGQVVGPRR